MNKTTIVAIAIIAIVVVSAVAYYLYYLPGDEWAEWKDTLIIGTTWVMINPDPHVGTSTGLDHNIAPAISDHLFWQSYDNPGMIQGQLAEEFEVRYETVDDVEMPYLWVKLKEGLHFNDGSEVTAEDIAYSFRRLIRDDVGVEQLGVIQWGFNYDQFEDDFIVAVSKYEVKMRLTTSFPMVAILLSGYAVNVALPISEAVGEAYPVGSNEIAELGLTGPLIQVEAIPQDRVVLEVREDYKDPQTGGWATGMGKADEKWPPAWSRCVIRTYGDSSALALALTKGDIDVSLGDLTATDILGFMDNPDITVAEQSGGIYRYLALNYKFPPLNDIKVRQAIAYTLDFTENVETVKQGLAEVAESCVHSYYPYFIPAFKDRYGVKNITKAMELLSQAGYEEGFTTKMVIAGHYAPIEEERNEALIIQDQLSDIGIDLEIEQVDSGTWKEMRRDGAIPIFMGGFYPDFPDPENDIEILSMHGGQIGYYDELSNQTKYPEEIYHFNEMNDLIEEGMELWDPDIPPEENTARQEVYEQQQEIFAEEVFYLPAYFGKGFLCSRAYVKNLKAHPVITNFCTPGILACWKEPPTTDSSLLMSNLWLAVPIASLVHRRHAKSAKNIK
jgi:peptide/nickel transport system substrate-binding protein